VQEHPLVILIDSDEARIASPIPLAIPPTQDERPYRPVVFYRNVPSRRLVGLVASFTIAVMPTSGNERAVHSAGISQHFFIVYPGKIVDITYRS
jgi:hypothetical protein